MYAYLPPRDYVESGKHVHTEISGRDRPKFFNRPVVPQINPNEAPLIHLAQTRVHGVIPNTNFMPHQQQQQEPPGHPRRQKQVHMDTSMGTMGGTTLGTPGDTLTGTIEEDGRRTICCQTDMRENECQTDPYTPDYYVEGGSNPEVLAIMTLQHNEGLPAGLAEVEMIDRIRRRKNVEMNLPQGSDDASMQTRLEQLEALEQVEWNEREQHIKELQEERLKQTAAALYQREAEREGQSADRLGLTRTQKMEATLAQKDKIRAKRQKATRMLEQTHSNPTQAIHKRDIINDYARHGPRGKAVETRSLVEKMQATNYDVRPTLLGFPEGVQELQRTEAPRVERVKKADTQPPEETLIHDLPTNYQKRLARQVVKDLDFANQTIIKAKAGPVGTQSITELYRATPRLIRPDTPTLVLEGDEDEEKEEALILLQRLLRGRSVQNDFFEGKERCHGLIEELQAAQKAKESEFRYTAQIEAEKFKQRQAQIVDGVIDAIQGDIIYTTMDYLAKELVRQREAAKFEKLRLQAESTRKQREDSEKQVRIAESTLRAREDAQFAQVQAINDYTTHTYLTGLLNSCMDYCAYRTALEEQLGIIEQEKQAGASGKSKEDEVCELMMQFIIPQVQKEQNKQKSEYALGERAKAQSAHIAATAALGGGLRTE